MEGSMNEFANPIGQSDIIRVKQYVESTLVNWKDYVVKNWKSLTRFLLISIDVIVLDLENTLLKGPDKKATVLDVLSKIYDAIIPDMLPYLLKPFNSQIKKFLFNVVLNVFIDYIVSKNNSLKGV
jgi:hypothetical protein